MERSCRKEADHLEERVEKVTDLELKTRGSETQISFE